MNSKINIEDLIEDLETGEGEEREEAAVKIAKLAALGDESVRTAVPQLRKAVHSDNPLRWKAASALAEIIHRYPEEVEGIETLLIDILEDKDDKSTQRNVILALTALESEKGIKNIEEIYNLDETHTQSICKIAMLAIPSEYEISCDFQHVKILVKQDPHRFQKLLNKKTITTPSKDCLAALALLTVSDDKESRIHVVTTARDQPDHFEKILPTIEKGFSITELWRRQYILFALAEYAKQDPERVANTLLATVSDDDIFQGVVRRISANGNLIVGAKGIFSPDSQESSVSPDEVNLGVTPEGISEQQLIGEQVGFVYVGGAFGLLVQQDLVTNKYIINQIMKQVRSDVSHSQSEIRDIRQNIDFEKISTKPKAQQIQAENPSRSTQEEVDSQPAAIGGQQSNSRIEKLRKKAKQNAVEEVPKNILTNTTETPQYNRSSEVKDYVKARADGVCEGCGEPAPFMNKTGQPYLHAHHIYELSEGGSDTPDTVIALCPNCHYRVHHGKDGKEYNQKLKTKLENRE